MLFTCRVLLIDVRPSFLEALGPAFVNLVWFWPPLGHLVVNVFRTRRPQKLSSPPSFPPKQSIFASSIHAYHYYTMLTRNFAKVGFALRISPSRTNGTTRFSKSQEQEMATKLIAHQLLLKVVEPDVKKPNGVVAFIAASDETTVEAFCHSFTRVKLGGEVLEVDGKHNVNSW